MDDLHSPRAVPFSWENKPGVTKVVGEVGGGYNIVAINLPLPPCPSDKPNKLRLRQGEPLHVPLPPGAFHHRPVRSLSKRGFKIEDDPFLMAYKKCTKTSRPQPKSSSSPLKALFGYFSCTASSRSVRVGTTVRIPQPPDSDDESDMYKA